MTRGYNELVGLQVICSRVIPRYRLTHHYRWRVNGKQGKTGTLRGYDMRRHIPIVKVLYGLADVYAPAVLTIWQRDTKAVISQYLQFEVGATPAAMNLDGEWHVWAQW